MIAHILKNAPTLAVLCVLQTLLSVYPLTATQAVTVSDVRVTTAGDSAAAARDAAIEQAYALAFQKLIKERFPGQTISTPSQTQLLSMVDTFSIDQEKTTPNSYKASFTFQFNDGQLQSLLDGGSSQPFSTSETQLSPHHQNVYQTKVNYDSLATWQQIKQALFSIPALQKVQIIRFSPQEAIVSFSFLGEQSALERQFLEKGLLFSLGDNEFTLSLRSN